MKKNNYINGLGACMLLASVSFTSCTEGNDWGVDASYDRLFSVSASSLGVTPSATTADVKWTGTPRSESYIIEVSKDSLYDEIPFNNGNSIVYGYEELTQLKSPYTITGLDSDSKYFIRIKAIASGKAESLWTYLENKSFNTKSEQIMESVKNADKTSTSVTLRWEAGATVTHILLTGGENPVTRNLTATEKEEGIAYFDGLNPATDYLANLYNGEIRRGYVNFTTFPDAPEAEVILYLSASDVIDQAYLDAIATEYPNKTVTLALAGDSEYVVAEKLIIPDGMSINFFGLPGNEKTVLSFQSTIDYSGTHSFIRFSNLDLDAQGKAYLMNQSAAAMVNEIEFDDCIIQNMATTFFRMQSTSGMKTVNSLVINNCIVRNIGSGYSFIHVDTGSAGSHGVLNNLTITNSTFYNICATNGKCFIYSRAVNMESIRIADCTLNNIGSSSNYFVDFSSTSYGASTFVINNTILGATGDATLRGVRASAAPITDATYATTDWAQTSNAVTSYINYSKSVSELFTNPSAGEFYILDSAFSGNAGDPRWKNQ
ncbi:MAG: DUF5123 domain-containing protein [Phocaeicola sp.]